MICLFTILLLLGSDNDYGSFCSRPMLKPFSGENFCPVEIGPKNGGFGENGGLVLVLRPPKGTLDKILRGGRYLRPNHLYKFCSPSVKGFLGGGGQISPFPRLSSSPLQHSRTAVRVCNLTTDRFECS